MVKKKISSTSSKAPVKSSVKKKKAPAKKSAKKQKSHKKIKDTTAQQEATATAKALSKSIVVDRGIINVPMKGDRVGRPSVLTEELIKQISQLILAGAYVETACAAAGLAKSMYYEWLKLGARRKIATPESRRMIDPIYEQFNDAINKAVVDAELRDIIRIDQAAEKTWTAAAWKLERKYPKRWARNYNIEHSGEMKQEVTAKVEVTVNERKENILKILADRNALDAAFTVLEALDEDKRLTDNGEKK